MPNNRTCGDCALWQHNGGTCPYFNEAFPATTLCCPKITSSVTSCDICGMLTIPRASFMDMTDPDHPHTVCANCQQHFGKCPTCQHSQTCSFETDPSSLPKMVQKQTRQGNMVQIMTVPNPERIRQTCQKGCPCFSEEFGCLRQNNSCGNHKIVYEGR